MNAGRTWRILFLGTGNSTRSLLAEKLLRAKGKGRFEAYSAGVQPVGSVHPFTAPVLADRYGLDASGLRSKSWDHYRGEQFDFVITVCDQARDACSHLPDLHAFMHWGSPDPVAGDGSEERRFRRFVNVASQIARRIDLMCALPDAKLQPHAVQGIGDRFVLEIEPAFALAL